MLDKIYLDKFFLDKIFLDKIFLWKILFEPQTENGAGEARVC